MRISVDSGGKITNIRIPSRIIFNSLTATIAGSAIISKSIQSCAKREVKVDARTARAVFREINRCRARYPDWILVEVDSAGGEQIRIRL